MPIMLIDNQSAIKIIKNPELCRSTKHVEITYHFIRQAYEEQVFEPAYVHTYDQVADVLTKPLSKTLSENSRTEVGVRTEK